MASKVSALKGDGVQDAARAAVEAAKNGRTVPQHSFSGGHGKLAAFAFMIFNLLCAPCFAAMGAIKREMNSAKRTLFAIGYQCCFAWVIAFIVWQLGRVFAGGMDPLGLILAPAMPAAVCRQLFKPYRESQKLTVR